MPGSRDDTTPRPPGLHQPIRLAPDEVHLWLADPDDPLAETLHSSYGKILSADETHRNARLRPSARREFLMGRALLRTTLSMYHPVPPGAWTFSANAHGRPELEPPWEIRFSLAHCEGLVACAVTAGSPVGVDAEPHSRARAVHGMAARVLSRVELADSRLEDLDCQRERALCLWTLKEAYLKGRGLGLSVPLPSITFVARSGRVTLADDGCAAQSEAWEFRLLRLDRHRVALATSPRSTGSTALRVWESIPLRGVRCRPDLELRADTLPGDER
jgi:4'-phosphopantetheinyl transferase